MYGRHALGGSGTGWHGTRAGSVQKRFSPANFSIGSSTLATSGGEGQSSRLSSLPLNPQVGWNFSLNPRAVFLPTASQHITQNTTQITRPKAKAKTEAEQEREKQAERNQTLPFSSQIPGVD